MAGATKVDTTNANAIPAGAGITFGGTVDGAFNLTLAAGTGTITFNAAVGSANVIGDGTGAALTITSGATTFNSTLATASGISSAADVTFKDDVTLAAGNTATTLNANTTFNKAGGLTFTAPETPRLAMPARTR
ncbi:MAG: hypothetical protein IPO58_25360 [Betaproteobacteria bacterium]|nr:hypothetical protein [Betaproteobacteria bacterium]